MRWLNFETGERMTNQVIHGDCMDAMREMEANSIDTIITDPPYHLGSISKRFTKTSLGDDNDTAANARNGSNQYARLSTGFMGARWDGGGIAFQPELWAEMLRVAKPGATLLAFGGTRTHHRLMVAIEDAGWEIRDCLMWLYGSGFPKSLSIGKSLDKQAGKEREVVGVNEEFRKKAASERQRGVSNISINNREKAPEYYKTQAAAGFSNPEEIGLITAPATEAAATWEGFGTGLKPAYEPIIYAQKPIEQTYANNAQVHGVAGLNIDGSRIGYGNGETPESINKSSGVMGGVFGNGKPSSIETKGRWPANVLLSHADGCVRRGEKRVRGNERPKSAGKIYGATENKTTYGDYNDTPYKVRGRTDPNGLETVADWECVDGCPIRILDEQAGVRKSGARTPTGNLKFNGVTLNGSSTRDNTSCEASTGSASRFFYTSKAPNREKWFFCQLCAQAYPNKERDDHGHDIDQGQRKHIVAHPTVKPLSILKYLCKLTKTPAGGIVLDPFAGSGTTGLACLETGRDFILIEKESDYYQIAKARVEAAMSQPRQAELW